VHGRLVTDSPVATAPRVAMPPIIFTKCTALSKAFASNVKFIYDH
jgi:hypothetical protein